MSTRIRQLSLRTQLAIVFGVLILGILALLLVVADLGLTSTAADPLADATTTVLLMAPMGPNGSFQFLIAPAASATSVLGVAPADLPLLALATWIVLVPLGLFIAWRLAGRIARPLATVAEAANRAGPANLGQRLPIDGVAPEVRQLNGAFNDLMSRFEHHELDRRRLVDDAAHEVRNPLAVMRTSLEVALADRNDPAALWTAAEVSQRAGERIARTIDGLHAELRDRTSETARTPVDLGDIARELGRDYAALGLRRGISIQVAAPAGTVVPADREALKRALANLIVNAIRFAPPGSPILVGAGSLPGWRWLGVRDFGPGIDAADQPLVFRRGWRGSAQDGDAGSGIGLALVRQIAEAHGGSVRLSSAPRAGSSFVLWLPVREADGREGVLAEARFDPLWQARPLLA